MPDHFEIGKIVNTQGIKGEVRVFPTTDDPSRFGLLTSVFVSKTSGSAPVNMRIERVRFHRNLVIIKFAGVDDMDAAEKLRGQTIMIPPELALPLDAGEYYVRDLYGMTVFTENGEELGTLTDVLSTGANDVYVISQAGQKDLLVPAIGQCIKTVDVENKKMIISLMEGLR